MLIHRDGWRYSGRVPEFFPGQAGCFCCPAPAGYHIRQYENDSAMAVLAQQSDNLTCFGLKWDGSTLVSVYNTGSYTRAKTYDSTLATLATVTHSYPWDLSGPFPGANRSIVLLGDGTFAMTATRTAADNSSAVASRNADGTLDWETNLEAFPKNGDAYLVAGDSSGNVYCWGFNSSPSGCLYKFNASGTLQWRRQLSSTPRHMVIASDGYIYCTGTRDLFRVSTSGTSSTLVTLNVLEDFNGPIESDQSAGVWVPFVDSSPTTHEIRNYDSSGTLLTTISDTELNLPSLGEIRFTVDSSDNVYALTWTGSVWRVKKWNSAGTLQWTSGNIGWSSSNQPSDITADADYIFVGGAYVP